MRAVLKPLLVTILLCCYVASFGHVGSPGINYQGKAGKYNVIINIYPPDIIPAPAEVSIYIENYKDEKVFVQTRYYSGGKDASVAPVPAIEVKNSKGWFTFSAMLMTREMIGLNIIIKDSSGKEGSVLIPVSTTVTAQRDMSKFTGTMLSIMGALLFFLLVSIIGASVGEGLVNPGDQVSPKLKRRQWIGIAVGAVLITVALYWGNNWWKSEHAAYNNTGMYKPITANSHIYKQGTENIFHLKIDTGLAYKSLNYVVPDHGKLMHLFLVKEKTLDAFAHLHPVRMDSLNYMAVVPDLPAGRYFVFADIVRSNGFPETITDTLTVTGKPTQPTAQEKSIQVKASPDDAFNFTTPVIEAPAIKNTSGRPVTICGTPGQSIKLDDGSVAMWEHGLNASFKVKRFYALTFSINDAAGKPVVLQPYMGMHGHAVVVKYDGSAYVHLHPTGNYAMASQELLMHRMEEERGKVVLPSPERFKDSINTIISSLDSMTEDERNVYFNKEMGGTMDMSGGPHSKHGASVIFPYSFPSPGKYRIWVQVKVKGRILSGAFDATVVQ